MTVEMSNDNFRISLRPNNNLPQELDLDPILTIMLEATDVLKGAYWISSNYSFISIIHIKRSPILLPLLLSLFR